MPMKWIYDQRYPKGIGDEIYLVITIQWSFVLSSYKGNYAYNLELYCHKTKEEQSVNQNNKCSNNIIVVW